MRVKLIFAWYDFWVGLFWDQKKKWIYIFPIPMFGILIKIKPKRKDFGIPSGIGKGKYPEIKVMQQYWEALKNYYN